MIDISLEQRNKLNLSSMASSGKQLTICERISRGILYGLKKSSAVRFDIAHVRTLLAHLFFEIMSLINFATAWAWQDDD